MNVYELKEILGQGANGAVYKAIRSDSSGHIHQTVAIKILNSKTATLSWEEEFRSLISVRSKRCVRVFGFDWVEGQPALILELVDGLSLTELLRWAFLSPEEICSVANQVAEGLADLHQHGMSHGDLSPNNVLLDRDGNIRLVDFGFANFSADRRRVTPEFAAPEILSQEIVASSGEDWWALGKILDFLVGHSRLPANAVPRQLHLLNHAPESRYFQPFSLSTPESVRRQLGRKVAAILDQRPKNSGPTQVIMPANVWRSVATRVAAAFLVWITMGPASVRGTPDLSAAIRIRSQYGVELEWDGKPIGYAPADLVNLQPGPHRLVWSTSQGRHERALTLQSRDLILIDDRTLHSR